MPYSYPILLVDDDPSIADLLTRSAKQIFPEATFTHVSSYAEAAQYMSDLTGKGPRLILLDVNLQVGLSGLEFLKLIRSHPQGRFLPVVMLSSSREDVDTIAAYMAGASAYTQKPDSYAGWKAYVGKLRAYWYETVTVPQLWFERNEDETDF
ncbi:response regulator [Spirosoma humi]